MSLLIMNSTLTAMLIFFWPCISTMRHFFVVNTFKYYLLNIRYRFTVFPHQTKSFRLQDLICHTCRTNLKNTFHAEYHLKRDNNIYSTLMSFVEYTVYRQHDSDKNKKHHFLLVEQDMLQGLNQRSRCMYNLLIIISFFSHQGLLFSEKRELQQWQCNAYQDQI